MASKEKYDRQLRLWGPRGQKKLSHAHVLLAGATAAGTETLKNLILPGVGRFTVLDTAVVSDADVSSNFFMEVSKMGRSRAETVCACLQDLNPDSTGTFSTRDIDDLIRLEREYFRQFTLIVTSNLSDTTLIPLSKICAEFGVHLVITESTGFIGSVRVQYENLEIIEGKNKNKQDPLQLFLNEPFPALKGYLERTSSMITSGELDQKSVGSLSYITVLYLAYKNWLEKFGNKPSTSVETVEFSKSIRQIFNNMRPPSKEATGGGSENVDNSIPDCFETSNQFYILQHYTFRYNDLLYQDNGVFGNGERPATAVTQFSVLTEAFRLFVERFDRLPVGGVIPDFSCSSATYREIQGIYVQQSLDDKAVFRQLITDICEKWGVDVSALDIDEELLDLFFKNLFHLKKLSTTPYYVEAESESVHELDNVFMQSVWEFAPPDGLGEEDVFPKSNNPFCWYIATRAARKFRALHNRSVSDGDGDELWALMMKDLQINPSDPGSNENHDQILEAVDRKIVDEVCRFEGKETIHSVSSFVGGVAAQEAVKLLAEMFEPMNNLVVYNGVIGNCQTFRITK